jgi:hypothetical protein
MSETLKRVLALVRNGQVRVSDHGYDELAADAIFVKDIIAGASGAMAIEDYPDYRALRFGTAKGSRG